MPKNIFEMMNIIKEEGFELEITNFNTIPADSIELKLRYWDGIYHYRYKTVPKEYFAALDESFEVFIWEMMNALVEDLKLRGQT